MSLNEEERRTLVTLEYEKAQAVFSQIEGLRSLGYWETSPIGFIMRCFMPYQHY